MKFCVTNHELYVGEISIIGVGLSSVVLIGDSDCISLGSAFDTPPESLVLGTSLVPL
ncbi:spore gernimation protein GerPD [Fictibacillus sp. b24]|uniref:spore gernimation protein GerPD n=1 Tax=unclassified Fictibacillus TaxID=2644029 RepID=UPI00259FF99C|nr:spore gernimation protein GerPD [Fictibacillus sp. b24]MDM5317997.1 spore gernimation protein GerPD [Fictibacillus sp. b24]